MKKGFGTTTTQAIETHLNHAYKQLAYKSINKTPISWTLRLLDSSLRVILYHDIGPDSEYTERIGVSTPTGLFVEHLQWLSKRYNFVSIEQILARELPPNPLLLTFDDAFQSVLRNAAPITQSWGIRPLMFVATSPVFDREILLDNLLSMVEAKRPEVLREFVEPGISCSAKEILGTQLPSCTAAKRLALRDRLAERIGSNPRKLAEESGIYLSPEDLCDLRRHDFDFGSHTHSHVHLRGLDGPELESELSRPIRLMRDLLGEISPTFSLPFGSRMDLTQAAADHLRAEGIKRTFLVEGLRNTRLDAEILCRHSIGALKTKELAPEIDVITRLRRRKIEVLQ